MTKGQQLVRASTIEIHKHVSSGIEIERNSLKTEVKRTVGSVGRNYVN